MRAKKNQNMKAKCPIKLPVVRENSSITDADGKGGQFFITLSTHGKSGK